MTPDTNRLRPFTISEVLGVGFDKVVSSLLEGCLGRMISDESTADYLGLVGDSNAICYEEYFLSSSI